LGLNPLVQRVFKCLFDRNKTSFVSPFMSVVVHRIVVPCERMVLVPSPHTWYPRSLRWIDGLRTRNFVTQRVLDDYERLFKRARVRERSDESVRRRNQSHPLARDDCAVNNDGHKRPNETGFITVEKTLKDPLYQRV